MNLVMDALSRRHALISILEIRIEPFDMFIHSEFHDFLRHDGFLFKGKKQYVLMSSTWQLLMNKVHKDGLMGHFGELKTFKILNDDFY
ncbi:hypothetical protein CR513_38463, partial [Mucuna pruriens]